MLSRCGFSGCCVQIARGCVATRRTDDGRAILANHVDTSGLDGLVDETHDRLLALGAERERKTVREVSLGIPFFSILSRSRSGGGVLTTPRADAPRLT